MFRVSVSLADFYEWNKQFNINNEIEYLKLLKDLDIDGVELHSSEKEILNLEVLKLKEYLKDLYVTFHLPIFKESEEVYNNLRKIQKELNINNFIIHANDYEKKKEIPKDLHIIIENTDKRKKKYQNTKKMIKFKHNFCFDIDHSEEVFKDKEKIKNQYNFIKNRIKEFHIATIHNSYYNQYKFHTYHKLITRSGKDLPRFLDKKTNFVIEGLIPKNRLDLLKEEIRLIKKINK